MPRGLTMIPAGFETHSKRMSGEFCDFDEYTDDDEEGQFEFDFVPATQNKSTSTNSTSNMSNIVSASSANTQSSSNPSPSGNSSNTTNAADDSNASFYTPRKTPPSAAARDDITSSGNTTIVVVNSNSINELKSAAPHNVVEESTYVLNELKNAILERNLKLVKQLFDKHRLDVNCVLNTDWIPVMYAVQTGSYEITSFLFDNGADLHFSCDSYSVLMSACGCVESSATEKNLIAIVELILSNGVDVESCDKYGQTPLMYACKAGNDCLIDCLVGYGADINATDEKMWTSLAHASHRGHTKCVKKLLRLDAEVYIASEDYLYPFDLAINAGHHNLKTLIKRYVRTKKLTAATTTATSSSAVNGSQEKEINKHLSDLLAIDSDSDGCGDDDDDADAAGNCDVAGQRSQNRSTAKSGSNGDDIASFLGALKKPHLIAIFEARNVTLQRLLSMSDEELRRVGVLDSFEREHIQYEICRFHARNWKSMSLIAVRGETGLTCNEIVAIVSNIARYLDFMTANVKYVALESAHKQQHVYQDNLIAARVHAELVQVSANCHQLAECVDTLLASVAKKLVKRQQQQNATKTAPIDLVKPSDKQVLRVSSTTTRRRRHFLIAASTIGLGVSCAWLVKKRFF